MANITRLFLSNNSKTIPLLYFGVLIIASFNLLVIELFLSNTPTNLIWTLVLLAWVIGLALFRFQWGIISALTIMVFTGFLNRVSYNFGLVDFQFLFAFPEISIVILFGHSILYLLLFDKQKIRLYRPLDFYVFGYISILVLQIFNPQSSVIVGLYGSRMELIPIGMYFLSRLYFVRSQDITHFYKLLIVLGNSVAIYGIFQQVFGLPNFEFTWFTFNPDILAQKDASIGGQFGWFIDGKLRVFSFLNGGQEFHFLLVIIFVFLATYRPLKHSDVFWKIGRVSCLLFSLLFLVLSFERTPMLMITIGVGATFIIRGSFLHKGTIRRGVTLGFVVVLTLMIFNVMQAQLVALAGNNIFLQRLIEVASPFSAESVSSGRFYLWTATLERIQESPLGYGLGSTFSNRASQGSTIIPPHNNFLRIAVELGIPGLILFLILHIQLLRQIMKSFKIVPIQSQLLLRTILGIILAMLACGLFNNPLQTSVAFYFWFLLGLIPILTQQRLVIH